MFSIDQLKYSESDFEREVLRHRKKYDNITSTIEEYISYNDSDQNINLSIIGGDVGFKLLTNQPAGRNDYKYLIYSSSAFKCANNLANLLALNQNDNSIICMKTTIANTKYQVLVNNIVFADIISLGFPHDMIKILIKPIVSRGLSTYNETHKKIMLVPPRFYLIELYKDLYSPAKAEHWEEYKIQEKTLFNRVKERINKLGGNTDLQPSLKLKESLIISLLQHFVSDNMNIALIGEYAAKFFIKNNPKSCVLKVISGPVNLEKQISTIRDIVSKTIGNKPVTYKIQNVGILQDHRLRRVIVYVDNKEIMYIYNSGEYELIPVNRISNGSNNIAIANLYVILRFLFIDIWLIRRVLSMGKIDKKFAKIKLNQSLNLIGILHKKMDKSEAKVFNLIPKTSQDYIGQVRDENIDQKIFLQKTKKRYYDYFPQEYYRNNKEYRSV